MSISQKITSIVKQFHQRNIFHRDIKPDNILIKKINGVYQVKLINFGFSTIIINTIHNNIKGFTLDKFPGTVAFINHKHVKLYKSLNENKLKK